MAAVVNGEKPSSAFLAHFCSYPVVDYSITTFKSNPYGKKSIDLAEGGYQSFAKPILPYFAKPYEYVSPYLSKADSIGDHTLTKVDERFPIVLKPTSELYDEASGIALFPYKKSMEGKDYVMKTYESECKKVGGDGIVTMGKAAFTTTLIVGSEALSMLSKALTTKKDQVKEIVNEKMSN